jgi:hypothetical protein
MSSTFYTRLYLELLHIILHHSTMQCSPTILGLCSSVNQKNRCSTCNTVDVTVSSMTVQYVNKITNDILLLHFLQNCQTTSWGWKATPPSWVNTIRPHQLREQIIADHTMFHNNQPVRRHSAAILGQHHLTMKQLSMVSFSHSEGLWLCTSVTLLHCNGSTLCPIGSAFRQNTVCDPGRFPHSERGGLCCLWGHLPCLQAMEEACTLFPI